MSGVREWWGGVGWGAATPGSPASVTSESEGG